MDFLKRGFQEVEKKSKYTFVVTPSTLKLILKYEYLKYRNSEIFSKFHFLAFEKPLSKNLIFDLNGYSRHSRYWNRRWLFIRFWTVFCKWPTYSFETKKSSAAEPPESGPEFNFSITQRIPKMCGHGEVNRLLHLGIKNLLHNRHQSRGGRREKFFRNCCRVSLKIVVVHSWACDPFFALFSANFDYSHNEDAKNTTMKYWYSPFFFYNWLYWLVVIQVIFLHPRISREMVRALCRWADRHETKCGSDL